MSPKAVKDFCVVKITQNVSEWLEPLKNALTKETQVIAYSQNDSFSGVMGLVNCIRKEPNGDDFDVCLLMMNQHLNLIHIMQNFTVQTVTLKFLKEVRIFHPIYRLCLEPIYLRHP